MSEYDVRMVVLSTDELDESIKFYSEPLGLPLKFRDGAHFVSLDTGSVTLASATAVDHPIPGQVVVASRPRTSTLLRGPSKPTAGAS